MPAVQQPCTHKLLQFETSPWAEIGGFQRQNPEERLAAQTSSDRNPLAAEGQTAKALQKLTRDETSKLATSFPGPLVLPNDDLNWDPDCPPQSFSDWLYEEHRNKPTQRRRTLYVASVPAITPEMAFMKAWKRPDAASATPALGALESPSVEDVVGYLGALYHGLSVRRYPERLRFVPWTTSSGGKAPKPGATTKHVGLGHGNECTRIRVRPAPDGVFKGQLSLEDLLDAAIAMLPDDAYALVLLMDHDLYEDEEDDFCCGRAYGGSRVCTVSAARYHPGLDAREGIDYQHLWPASHCKDFVDALCAVEGVKKPTRPKRAPPGNSDSPLRRAVEAASGAVSSVPATTTPEEAQRRGLWFSRLARTAAHELGHCLGLDHCVYYACAMQGTAGTAEDNRQPPYLCPVCLAKISHAVARELRGGGGKEGDGEAAYVRERYEAIAAFCESWRHVGLFAGYGAWVRARLELSA
ncbi:hypothetical protein GGR56DRAFT_417055 [Xylariaceae sp. FL0804]|nr:hypothetical protein GGR56DRAFT_417055 [Xylariaceae sp. FL0804]